MTTAQRLHSQRGGSHLVLVLVVAMVLILIVTSIQVFTFIQTKQAAQTTFSKQAYFAAEGSLFETIQHVRNDPSWPINLPYTDQYIINDSLITRVITYDPATQTYLITVTSDSGGAQRKLVGEFQLQQETGLSLDSILVIDRSGSMAATDSTGQSSLDQAKSAAISFLDILEDQAPDSQVALVTYSGSATLDQGLTPFYDQVRDALNSDDLDASGTTNIGDAVYVATTELDLNAREDSKKVIIVMSDGVAQQSHSNVCGNSCQSSACSTPGSGFSPDDQGNCCSQNAIQLSQQAQSGNSPAGNPREYQVFSISLTSNYTSSACNNLESTKTLGRLTMLRVSSQDPADPLPSSAQEYTYYKEAASADQLGDIYSQIAEIISSPEFFEYQEVEP